MGKKILLADDSITIQKVIELTFSDEDFEVVTVGNGRLALERLPEVRPDIVLCDIIMPEKDGYEVCEQIKSNPSSGHIPVLLLTGAFEPFDQERAARAGYDGSLAKPFEPETLIAKVKELLAKAPRPVASAPSALPVTSPMPSATPGFVSPPAKPAAPAPPPRAASAPAPVPATPSFIPDEPFSGLDDGAFEVEPERDPAALTSPAPPLAAISPEEADTLTSVDETEDRAATVMLRSDEHPWPTPPPAAATQAAAETSAIPPRPEPEAPVFEAVLEEDLDFGPGDYVGGGSGRSVPDISEAFSANAGTLPPVAEVEEGTSGPFAALVRSEQEPQPEAVPDTAVFASGSGVSEEELLEPEPVQSDRAAFFSAPPRVPLEDEPEPPARRLLEPLPAVRAPEPAPPTRPSPAVSTPEPAAAAAPRPPLVAPPPLRVVRPPEPVAAHAPQVAEARPQTERPRSLLDASPLRPEPHPPTPMRPVEARAPRPEPPKPQPDAHAAANTQEVPGEVVVTPEPPARPSEAAGIAVPAEMVEKIAQRVIAQISEKIVREVAWEVIPDLAEALIKREIERLKAELAKP